MKLMRAVWLLAGCLAAARLLATPVKVACIGDSITEGSGLGNPSVESYPAKLGKLLGAAYQVKNYGVSARTLLKKGDYPYWKESAFTQSHTWNPDVVIIKLGSNDSKPYNWRYGTNFVSDYEEMVASYAVLPGNPRILLCTPCPVYGSGAFDISPGVVATNIRPAVIDLGARLGLGVIDLHTLMAGHKEWFPDSVHPNTKGTTVMAAIIRSAIVGEGGAGGCVLSLNRLPPTRVVLSWPAEDASLVLQSTTVLRLTNTVWSVVEQVAYNDGAIVRVTNNAPGTLKLYRLWQP